MCLQQRAGIFGLSMLEDSIGVSQLSHDAVLQHQDRVGDTAALLTNHFAWYIATAMAEQPKSIDVSDVPDMLRLAEEVRRAGEPRILRRNGEDLAMVVPLPRAKKPRLKKTSAEDLAAFRQAAGSWADIDTDKLIEDIYRARREGTRLSDRP